MKNDHREAADARHEQAAEAPPARHYLRFEKVPAGFIRFRGKGDPIKNDKALVELVVRTARG
jgi:hypothetical protein